MTDLRAGKVSPLSSAVDLIVHADRVEQGDLMVHRGVLAFVEKTELDHSQPAHVCITVQHDDLLPTGRPLAVWMLRDQVAAVRRYKADS